MLSCVSTFTPSLTASTAARARVRNASTAKNTPQNATGTPTSRVYSLGRLRVRSACGAGVVEPPCNSADLGYYEAGAVVSITGGIIDTIAPDCKQWQGVNWQGKTGYVCAAWLAR